MAERNALRMILNRSRSATSLAARRFALGPHGFLMDPAQPPAGMLRRVAGDTSSAPMRLQPCRQPRRTSPSSTQNFKRISKLSIQPNSMIFQLLLAWAALLLLSLCPPCDWCRLCGLVVHTVTPTCCNWVLSCPIGRQHNLTGSIWSDMLGHSHVSHNC